MKVAQYADLIERFENPIDDVCPMKEGMVFISEDAKRPEGMCDSAWGTISPFVKDLSEGRGDFYNGWMKDDMSAMISCDDGFRPVSFYVELIR